MANSGSAAEGPNAMVYVYGHGPARNPFYKEARAFNATAEGAFLILNAAVNQGQKLLLMNGTQQDPVEAQVVRIRTQNAQTFEIEVALTIPRLDFWKPFRGGAQHERKGAAL